MSPTRSTAPSANSSAREENAHLEYKSTLRWDIRRLRDDAVPEKAVVKTVAGFLNSRDGGTLLIGVADDGTVYGLESDYASLRKGGKDDRDVFQLHLSQVLVNALGEAAAAEVTAQMHTVAAQDLCRVHARPSSFPVEASVKVEKNGQVEKKTAFYVRIGNGTKEIPEGAEKQKLIAGRWGKGAVDSTQAEEQ